MPRAARGAELRAEREGHPPLRGALKTEAQNEGRGGSHHEGFEGKEAAEDRRILAVNVGSTSLKVTLCRLEGAAQTPELVARAELIGPRGGRSRLGVSGTTSDMRQLLAREGEDRRDAEAVDLFCYAAKKHLGAFVAALGGLDTLVFTGGTGKHAAPVRERICAGLGFLGVALDPDPNAKNEDVVSGMGSRVTVRVMTTDENLMVARHTGRLIALEGASEDVPF